MTCSPSEVKQTVFAYENLLKSKWNHTRFKKKKDNRMMKKTPVNTT